MPAVCHGASRRFHMIYKRKTFDFGIFFLIKDSPLAQLLWAKKMLLPTILKHLSRHRYKDIAGSLTRLAKSPPMFLLVSALSGWLCCLGSMCETWGSKFGLSCSCSCCKHCSALSFVERCRSIWSYLFSQGQGHEYISNDNNCGSRRLTDDHCHFHLLSHCTVASDQKTSANQSDAHGIILALLLSHASISTSQTWTQEFLVLHTFSNTSLIAL